MNQMVVVGGETNKKMKFRSIKEEWVTGIRDQVKKLDSPSCSSIGRAKPQCKRGAA